jgi:hypothetical protein
MGVFSGRVDAVVVALSWRRTVVVEQGRWESRRTAWKPHGKDVRNLKTVHKVEADLVFNVHDHSPNRGMGVQPRTRSREVMEKHTYFEYEEFSWHRYRSFSARGEDTADVRWPEYDLGPDQRISERREAYRAKFSAGAADDGDGYTAELDQATWQALKAGMRCRLRLGALSGEVKQVVPSSAPAKSDGRRSSGRRG